MEIQRIAWKDHATPSSGRVAAHGDSAHRNRHATLRRATGVAPPPSRAIVPRPQLPAPQMRLLAARPLRARVWAARRLPPAWWHIQRHENLRRDTLGRVALLKIDQQVGPDIGIMSVELLL